MTSELHLLLLAFLFVATSTAAVVLIRLFKQKTESSSGNFSANMPEFSNGNFEAISRDVRPEFATSDSSPEENTSESSIAPTGLASDGNTTQEQVPGAAIADDHVPSPEPSGQTDREGEEQLVGPVGHHGDERSHSMAVHVEKPDQRIPASSAPPNSEPVDEQDQAEAIATTGEEGTAICGSDTKVDLDISEHRASPGESVLEVGKVGDAPDRQVEREPAEERRVEEPSVSIDAVAGEMTSLESSVAPTLLSDIELAAQAGMERDAAEEAEQLTERRALAGEREGTEPPATKTETSDAPVQSPHPSEEQSSPETAGRVESGDASGRVGAGVVDRAGEEEEQDELTAGNKRAGLESDAGRLTRSTQKQRFKKKQPRRYRGLNRGTPDGPEAVPRATPTAGREDLVRQTRSLPIAVRIRFHRGGAAVVSLIARRSASLPENLTAFGSSREEVALLAIQDEWYQDFVPDNLSSVLRKGTGWTYETEDGQYSWSLSGREIHVLAPRPDISGFVSAPCLVLGREHLVLCTAGKRELVEKAIQAAGAQPSGVLEESRGAPPGWLIFMGVVPVCSVQPEEGANILNALRPVPDIQISLEGGIRLQRGQWLEGYPPSIRVYGAPDSPEVSIDGRIAERSADGSYRSDGWDSVGGHSVWCGGKSCSYSIVSFEASWELFDAYTFSNGVRSEKKVTICGPVVRVGEAPRGSQTICVPVTNRVVLGPEPGQSTVAFKATAVGRAPCIAQPSFPAVWALPDDPIHCDKKLTRILFVASVNPTQEMVRPGRIPHTCTHIDVERWCRLILDANRKGMVLDPDTAPVRELWHEYTKLARRIWRARK